MIVSGGENVFPREVEDLPGAARGRARGRGDRRRRPRLRQAAAGLRASRERADVTEDELKEHVEAEPRSLQGAARDRDHGRAAPQRDRQAAQAGARHRLRDCPPRWKDAAHDRTRARRPRAGLTLRDQFGQDVTLSSYRGSKAVAILFYPYAFSGVCTGEMAGIRDRLAESRRSTPRSSRSRATPSTRCGRSPTRTVSTSRCSDFWPHGEVSRAYDAFDDKRGCPRRSSYVIDKDGLVRWSVHNAMPEGRDLDEHLRQLSAVS